jgi:hypothetical protein
LPLDVERAPRDPTSARQAPTRRSDDVKYMLLIYQNPESFQALPEDELKQLMSDVDALMEELTKSGEWVGGEGLAHPSNARTVKVRDGVPVVTDGPYLESKEHLVGYSMFECDSIERATEIAARWPDARYWAVELRPVMTPGGTEM